MRERLVMLVVIVLLAALSWYGFRDALEQRQAVTRLELSLKNERARTARIQAQVVKVETERDKAQRGLAAALKASKGWADSPAPVPVRDELCKRLRCK